MSLAKRGRGYWKFNAQLLHDLDYIAVVKKCIHDTILEYHNSGNITDLINIELSVNDQMFFEILKMKIRSLTINYSINKSKQEKSDMKKLEQEIQDLENAFVHNPVEQIKNKLNDKKNMQIRQREKIIDGIILRSKAEWYENGEKCSKFFCCLEKRNFLSKTVSELIDEKGNHLSSTDDVLNEQKLFYKKLYSTRRLPDIKNLHESSFFSMIFIYQTS